MANINIKDNYIIIKDSNHKKTARFIASGEIIAFCNGKMEFGERALGSRSILADPRKQDTKDKINSIIKYRENYRRVRSGSYG